MKTTKIAVLFLLLFSLSCSSESEETENEDNSFEGLWVLRDFEGTDNITSQVVPELNDFIELVVDEGCELISFDFKVDQLLIAEFYNTNDFNDSEDPVEYTVDCEDIDVFGGTWNLNGDQLTIITSEGESISFSYRFESDNRIILEDVPLAILFPLDGQVDLTFMKIQQ